MEIDSLNEAFSDRYCIKRELGRGGMAVVYLACDKTHEQGAGVLLQATRPLLSKGNHGKITPHRYHGMSALWMILVRTFSRGH